MNRIKSKLIVNQNIKATSRTSRRSRAETSSPTSSTWLSPTSVGSTNQEKSLRSYWTGIKTQDLLSKSSLHTRYTWKRPSRPSHPRTSFIWSSPSVTPPPPSSASMSNDTTTWSAEQLSLTTSTPTDPWSFSHHKNITKQWKLITSGSIDSSSMTSNTTIGSITPR